MRITENKHYYVFTTVLPKLKKRKPRPRSKRLRLQADSWRTWPGSNRRPPASKDWSHEKSTTYSYDDELGQIATSHCLVRTYHKLDRSWSYLVGFGGEHKNRHKAIYEKKGVSLPSGGREPRPFSNHGNEILGEGGADRRTVLISFIARFPTESSGMILAHPQNLK